MTWLGPHFYTYYISKIELSPALKFCLFWLCKQERSTDSHASAPRKNILKLAKLAKYVCILCRKDYHFLIQM